MQNIGYLSEQLDLYLTSKYIGTLWYGMGKPNELRFDELDYVTMMAIAQTDGEGFRKDMFKSKRKPLGKIWHGEELGEMSERAM